MTHGTRRLPSGRYFAWHGAEEVTYETKGGAESWVIRQLEQRALLKIKQALAEFV